MVIPSAVALGPLALGEVGLAADPDLTVLTRIRQEGLLRSQVVDMAGWIADVYGPRLTGSKSMREASEWAAARLREWKLEAVRHELFDFGTAWSAGRFTARMTAPYSLQLIGSPHLWSAGTVGLVSGELVVAPAASEFASRAEAVAGRIVLAQEPRPIQMLDGPPIVLRMGRDLLDEVSSVMPVLTPEAPSPVPAALRRIHQLSTQFGALAVLDRGIEEGVVEGGQDFLPWHTQRTDGGTLFPARDPREGGLVPAATLAAEHYNQLVRLIRRGARVRMDLEIETSRHDGPDIKGINTFAEIPGTERPEEVVLLGAHLDSVHPGTGATDNAAGVAATMEAMRILRTVGVAPRRTIRLALWDGEEHGLTGSAAYVKEHLADRSLRTTTPDYKNLYAYFNLDNGAGRIRGVWAQGNLGALPLLESWLDEVKDLGAGTVARRSVGSSDHLSFEAVGQPGFQFMQDRLEYNSRSHHSNMDVADRIQPADLIQMATVVASVVYRAANDPRDVPKKGFPSRYSTPPTLTISPDSKPRGGGQ